MDDIYEIKRHVSEYMMQCVTDPNNMDVQELGMLADIVKDLAEAEYYCTVAESMDTAQGYDTRGYDGGSRGYAPTRTYQRGRGYQNQPMPYARGYDADPMSAIRAEIDRADPQRRQQLIQQLQQMMGQM